MKEPLKSLSELAFIYEEWAKENEATAKKILACLDSYVEEAREHQRWRASQLVAEAAELKIRAAELRNLDQRRSMYCVDPTIAPLDHAVAE